MKNTHLAIAAGVIVIILAAIWYTKTPATEEQVFESTMGSYAYQCDEHVEFLMTPASDMSYVKIEPVAGKAYPPETLLAEKVTDTGRRFEGNGIHLLGRGESLSLTEGDQTLNCSPFPKPDEAPFNFGD